MTRKVLLIFGLLLFEIFCYSLENKLTKDGVTDFFNPLKNWPGENWYYGRSSVLVEDKTDIFHYEHCNIWDEDLSTAWVEGVEGNGIGEWVIVNVDGNYQYFDYADNILEKKFKIKLKISNGFCQNERTFYNNNRVKKARISIYEVPLFTGQHKTFALEEPYIMFENEIELQDSIEEQSFVFETNPKALHSEGLFYLYVQLTILDVYPGEKYQDTCISEMSATAEVIEEETKEKKKSLFKRK